MREFVINEAQIVRTVHCNANWDVKLPVTSVTIHGERLSEVVRCRDCINYKPYRTHRHGIMNRCYDENGHTHRRDESDFCSRGERREQ